MSASRLSEQLRALQQRQQDLKQQLAQLHCDRRSLLLRQAILATWCDSLTAMQLSLSLGDKQHQQQDVAVDAAWKQLLEREVRLLEQLNSSVGCSTTPPKPLEQLLEPDDRLISPVTDPMGFLYTFMSRPPMEEAATMTAQDVAVLVQGTTQQLSIKLHQLAALPPWSRADMVQELRECWDRYLHCIASLVLLGRQDVVEQAYCINLDTLESEPAEAARHQSAQAAVLVPLLGLSEQQEELIAVAMHLYYELLAVVHNERQEVHTQMTSLEAAAPAASAADDARADADSAGSSSASNGQHTNLPEWQEQLEKQEALTSRLTLLLHKEYKLRMTAMSWFIGSLSFEQLSRMAVMSWPYAMRTLFIATTIMQRREKLVQQRLEQLG